MCLTRWHSSLSLKNFLLVARAASAFRLHRRSRRLEKMVNNEICRRNRIKHPHECAESRIYDAKTPVLSRPIWAHLAKISHDVFENLHFTFLFRRVRPPTNSSTKPSEIKHITLRCILHAQPNQTKQKKNNSSCGASPQGGAS